MAARVTRLVLFALTLVIGCLYLVPRLRPQSSRKFEIYTTSTREALDALKCSIDPLDPVCETSSSDSSSSEETNEKDVVTQDGPGKLEYPNGFKQFDTSNPSSPYHQDTYGVQDVANTESIVSDSQATYLQRLQAWTPYNAKYNGESHNPVILQIYRDEPGDNSIPYQSWMEKNKPKWSRTFVPHSAVDSMMDGLSRELEFLNETFHRLPARVLKMDFMRYVSLFKDGGVYADIDTNCYVGIDRWYSACYAESPSTKHGERIRAAQPGLVVGLEFDLLGDPRFETIDERQVALANYVFAANKGHPVLAQMIDAIAKRTLQSPGTDSSSSSSSSSRSTASAIEKVDAPGEPEFDIGNYSQVYAWTGRRIWTDTIIAHIQSTVQGFKERDLLGLKKAKVFGDICVLPVSAFGSGQLKYKNSPDSESEGVLVKHFAMHLWDG